MRSSIVPFDKEKKSSLSIFVSAIWCASAVFSLVFYSLNGNNWEFRTYTNLTLPPFIFIFVCILLYIIPLTRIEDRSAILVDADYSLLTIFSWIIVTISIAPFFANLIYAINHIGESLSSFAENYGTEVEIFDGSIAILNKYAKYARTFSPILLFYFLQRPNPNKLLLIGLFCAFINPSLGNLNSGSRFLFAADFLYLIAIYLIFSNSIDDKVRSRIRIIGSLLLSFFIVVFLSISIFRFTTTNSSSANIEATTSFGLYAGEGMLNFSSNMWNISKRTDGSNTLTVVDYMIGDNPSSVRDADKVSAKAGIPLNIFYTVVGDFYIDFGPNVTLAIFFGIFLLLSFLLRKQKTQYSFYELVWICLFIRIIVIGFTYFPYMNLSMELVYVPILNIVLSFLDSAKNSQ
ncbi:MAG: oligosaccharide repeat unit polymerase [Salinivirgaceae bacterium]|nr:oligosaccharide repeat unit polymerase [Salinivirgaceae bacterium]